MTKISVFNSPDSVQVDQYRKMDKGTLKAFFSLMIYPAGLRITDCRYFAKDDKRWFNFPEKEVPSKDGGKSKYFPYVSCLNKEYLQELQNAVLMALKEFDNGKTQDRAHSDRPRSVQGDASSDWDELPF